MCTALVLQGLSVICGSFDSGVGGDPGQTLAVAQLLLSGSVQVKAHVLSVETLYDYFKLYNCLFFFGHVIFY